MTTGPSGWSLIGILAAICIVAGIVLLVAYAVRGGLVNRELDGTDAEADAGSEEAAGTGDPGTGAPGSAGARRGRRTLGTLGAAALVLGLALGTVAALGGWSGSTSTGPGAAPADCVQGWNGCPATTLKP
jgi:hypothetical protein